MKPDELETYRVMAGIKPFTPYVPHISDVDHVYRELGHAMLTIAYAPAFKAGKPWAKLWFKHKGDLKAYDQHLRKLKLKENSK